MKKKHILLAIVLLVIPPIMSYLINLGFSQSYINGDTQFQNIMSTIFPFWQFIHYPYWLIVGGVFYHLSKNKMKNLMVFLVPVLLLGLTYGIHNIFLSGEGLFNPVYTIAQLFASGFTGLSSIMVVKLNLTLGSTVVVLLAYLINILIFSVGFIILNGPLKIIIKDEYA